MRAAQFSEISRHRIGRAPGGGQPFGSLGRAPRRQQAPRDDPAVEEIGRRRRPVPVLSWLEREDIQLPAPGRKSQEPRRPSGSLQVAGVSGECMQKGERAQCIAGYLSGNPAVGFNVRTIIACDPAAWRLDP